jgi:hypothetical protein
MSKGRRRKQAIVLAAFVVAVFSVTPAHSDVIYSSFGADYQYDTSQALVLGSFEEGPPPLHDVIVLWGFPFTPTFNATLDSVKFAAMFLSGTNQGLNVMLMSSSGEVPATVLETMSLTIGSEAVYTTNSSLHIALAEGTEYWVVLAAQGDGSFGWFNNSEGIVGPAARTELLAPVPWYRTSLNISAFAVEGTSAPVPVPAAVWLLGSGLVGLVGLRRRMRK